MKEENPANLDILPLFFNLYRGGGGGGGGSGAHPGCYFLIPGTPFFLHPFNDTTFFLNEILISELLLRLHNEISYLPTFTPATPHLLLFSTYWGSIDGSGRQFTRSISDGHGEVFQEELCSRNMELQLFLRNLKLVSVSTPSPLRTRRKATR